MAGLFFCLASAEGAGLLFCPATIQPYTSVYSAFCVVWRVHPAIPHRLRHVGAPTSARTPYTDIRYHRNAGRCTGQHSRLIIIRYIRVHGCVPVMDPCQTGQHTADHASPAHLLRGAAPPPVQGQPGGVSMLPTPGGLRSGTGQRSGRTSWHFLPGGAVQQQGCGGRRGTIGGSRRSSFRAFAR